jgi:hypothetical protein
MVLMIDNPQPNVVNVGVDFFPPFMGTFDFPPPSRDVMQEHRWQACRGRTTHHVGVLLEPQHWQLKLILKFALT